MQKDLWQDQIMLQVHGQLQLLIHFLLLDDVQAGCDAGAVALKVGLAVSRSCQAQPGVMSCKLYRYSAQWEKFIWKKNLSKYELIFFIHIGYLGPIIRCIKTAHTLP